jgi:hypothetical protein
MKRFVPFVVTVVVGVILVTVMTNWEAVAQAGKKFSVLGLRAVFDDSLRVGKKITNNGAYVTGVGAVIATDSAIIVPAIGETFYLTGTDSVEDIHFATSMEGRRITFISRGSCKITDGGTRHRIKTAGVITLSADDVISFYIGANDTCFQASTVVAN